MFPPAPITSFFYRSWEPDRVTNEPITPARLELTDRARAIERKTRALSPLAWRGAAAAASRHTNRGPPRTRTPHTHPHYCTLRTCASLRQAVKRTHRHEHSAINDTDHCALWRCGSLNSVCGRGSSTHCTARAGSWDGDVPAGRYRGRCLGRKALPSPLHPGSPPLHHVSLIVPNVPLGGGYAARTTELGAAPRTTERSLLGAAPPRAIEVVVAAALVHLSKSGLDFEPRRGFAARCRARRRSRGFASPLSALLVARPPPSPSPGELAHCEQARRGGLPWRTGEHA